MDAYESKCYVCWQVTDALEHILQKDSSESPFEFVPGATDEFLDDIEPFITDNYLLTFHQGGGLDHWFTVLYSNDKVYLVESNRENSIDVKSNTKSEFLSWMQQLLDKDITDNFYKEYVNEMRVFIHKRKALSLRLIGNFIAKNIKVLSN